NDPDRARAEHARAALGTRAGVDTAGGHRGAVAPPGVALNGRRDDGTGPHARLPPGAPGRAALAGVARAGAVAARRLPGAAGSRRLRRPAGPDRARRARRAGGLAAQPPARNAATRLAGWRRAARTGRQWRVVGRGAVAAGRAVARRRAARVVAARARQHTAARAGGADAAVAGDAAVLPRLAAARAD